MVGWGEVGGGGAELSRRIGVGVESSGWGFSMRWNYIEQLGHGGGGGGGGGGGMRPVLIKKAPALWWSCRRQP